VILELDLSSVLALTFAPFRGHTNTGNRRKLSISRRFRDWNEGSVILELDLSSVLALTFGTPANYHYR